MTVRTAKRLNDKGQCCGRKPLVYKRPPHLFCHRCNADYNLEGEQIQNWAWKKADGGFVATYPTHGYAQAAGGKT